jgi:hypothetical protein
MQLLKKSKANCKLQVPFKSDADIEIEIEKAEGYFILPLFLTNVLYLSSHVLLLVEVAEAIHCQSISLHLF